MTIPHWLWTALLIVVCVGCLYQCLKTAEEADQEKEK